MFDQKKRLIFLAAGVLSTLIGYLFWINVVKPQYEHGKFKQECLALQIIEFKHRSSNNNKHLLFDAQNEYKFVGIKSAEGNYRIWILLNPEVTVFGPGILSIGLYSFQLTKEELNEILTFSPETRKIKVVANLLRNHLNNIDAQ